MSVPINHSNTGIKLVPKATEGFVPKCFWFILLITGRELCLTLGVCSYFSHVRTLTENYTHFLGYISEYSHYCSLGLLVELDASIMVYCSWEEIYV